MLEITLILWEESSHLKYEGGEKCLNFLVSFLFVSHAFGGKQIVFIVENDSRPVTYLWVIAWESWKGF